MRTFDRRLSLAIDACYVELDRIQADRNTIRRLVRLVLWRCRFGRLVEKDSAMTYKLAFSQMAPITKLQQGDSAWGEFNASFVNRDLELETLPTRFIPAIRSPLGIKIAGATQPTTNSPNISESTLTPRTSAVRYPTLPKTSLSRNTPHSFTPHQATHRKRHGQESYFY